VEATVHLAGLGDVIRIIVRDELARALEGQSAPSGYLDVARTADFLSTTQPAIRAMVKRREIPVLRTPNGRLLFERAELDAWARGEPLT
jgi:Helix-turn-helix domain